MFLIGIWLSRLNLFRQTEVSNNLYQKAGVQRKIAGENSSPPAAPLIVTHSPVTTSSALKPLQKAANEMLEMFSFPPPPMNEVNIEKHRQILEQLNEDPGESLEYFKDLVKSNHGDDNKRTMIINFVNKLNLSSEEKSQFYNSYIADTKVQLVGDTLHDNSLSILIAIDYLSQNITKEEAVKIIDALIEDRSEIEKSNILDRFATYFPEVVSQMR